MGGGCPLEGGVVRWAARGRAALGGGAAHGGGEGEEKQRPAISGITGRHWFRLAGGEGLTPLVLLRDALRVGVGGHKLRLASTWGSASHTCHRNSATIRPDARPFALHTEAPDRCGRGTRLASPARTR